MSNTEERQGMFDTGAVDSLIQVQPEATVSRTILRGDGVRVVAFAFDKDQVLTEHTAAMPVILETVSGMLRVSADGRSVDVAPGQLIYLRTREPHEVYALEPSIMLLTMIDARRSHANSQN